MLKKNKNQETAAADYPYRCPPLKKREKFTYTIGNIGTDIVGAVVMTYMLIFYTDVAGIPAAIAGTIFLFSRIFDAFTDLIMGWLVDRTHTKWGKARPWLLWMIVPCMLSSIAMFYVPNISLTGKIIYAIITYNISNGLFGTAMVLPYNTLSALATDNTKDRAQIGVLRLLGTVGIGIITNIILYPAIKAIGGSKESPTGWFVLMLILSVIGAAAMLFTFFNTKERLGTGVKSSVPAEGAQAETKKASVPMKKVLPLLFRNKYWVLLLLINIMVQLVSAAVTARSYYAIYILGSEDYITYMVVAVMLPMVLAFPFIGTLIKKFGKIKTALYGLFLGIFAYILQALMPYNLTMVIVSAAVRGVATALITAPLNSVMADVIDHEEWRSGTRAEGVTSSATSFAAKCGTGLAAALVGWILAAGKYNGELDVQPQSANNAIIFAAIYLPIIIYVISIVLLLMFNLDKLMPRIARDLKARKEGYVSQLKYSEIIPSTPEKKDKRLALVNLVPKGILEKKMRNNLPDMRGETPQKINLAKRGVNISDYTIQGYNGKIAVRLYMPAPAAKRPLTVFFHGGAFIGGRMSGTDAYCAAYADKMDEAVLSVEYHLAPEHPFPHGLEDCYSACKWAFENAGILNIDRDKITVSGDSAGGNFAAVIGLMAKERKDFPISRLILIYPYTTFAAAELKITKIMHSWYLNGAERTNPYISPLDGDVAGLPPTITFVCEYDLLAGSGKDFAEKLAGNGVDSTCVMFKKTRHAFLDQIGTLKQTEELLDLIKEWKDSGNLSAQQNPAYPAFEAVSEV